MLQATSYGLTAQQLLAKIKRDSGVTTILAHLLKGAKPREVEKLLLQLIPAEHAAASELNDFGDVQTLDRLSNCFRIALVQSNDEIRQKVANRFVEILRNESDSYINRYAEAFFQAGDLRHLSSPDISMVTDYILERFQNVPARLLPVISGISQFATAIYAHKIIDPMVRAIRGETLSLQNCEAFMQREKTMMAADFEAAVMRRLNRWEEGYEERKDKEGVNVIRQLKLMLDDIPF